jgi:hypothetical protein
MMNGLPASSFITCAVSHHVSGCCSEDRWYAFAVRMGAYHLRDRHLQASIVSNRSAYKCALLYLSILEGCSLNLLIAILTTVLTE